MAKEIYGIEIFPNGDKVTYPLYKLLTNHDLIEILSIEFIEKDTDAKFEITLKSTQDSIVAFDEMTFELTEKGSCLPNNVILDMNKYKLELDIIPIKVIAGRTDYPIRIEYCQI